MINKVPSFLAVYSQIEHYLGSVRELYVITALQHKTLHAHSSQLKLSTFMEKALVVHYQDEGVGVMMTVLLLKIVESLPQRVKSEIWEGHCVPYMERSTQRACYC